MFGWCGAGWLCLSVGFALDGATLVGFAALSLCYSFAPATTKKQHPFGMLLWINISSYYMVAEPFA